MAYNGYLIKVGSYTIPNNLIKAESYDVVMHVQDLDSFRDGNGFLHRTVLEHIVHEVNFNLVPMLTNSDVSDIWKKIRSNYIVASERKVSATIYVPELDDYVTQDMYMPDTKFPIYGTYEEKITYNTISVSFIGY